MPRCKIRQSDGIDHILDWYVQDSRKTCVAGTESERGSQIVSQSQRPFIELFV